MRADITACDVLGRQSPRHVHRACWRYTRGPRRCRPSTPLDDRGRVCGSRGVNPVVAPFSQSPAAMYAFKAATTTRRFCSWRSSPDTPRRRNRIDGRCQRRVRERRRATTTAGRAVSRRHPPTADMAPQQSRVAGLCAGKLMRAGSDAYETRRLSLLRCVRCGRIAAAWTYEEELRVFVVDDDPLVLRAIERVLRSKAPGGRFASPTAFLDRRRTTGWRACSSIRGCPA